MEKLMIYIASSWKNQHAVDMLTDLLEKEGFEVNSFVRNANEENLKSTDISDFENWIKSHRALESFGYDTTSASNCDYLVYISPSGSDAWAEVGICWSKSKARIYGLISKGEQVGLMRLMMHQWFDDYRDLIKQLKQHLESYIIIQKAYQDEII